MALPALLIGNSRKWMVKTLKKRELPERDVCLMEVFISPMTTLELNRITNGDIISKSGKINKRLVIRSGLSANNKPRHFFPKAAGMESSIKQYINWLIECNYSLGDNPDQYQGRDPDAPFFVTKDGHPFKITVTPSTTKGSDPTYKCEPINNCIRELMSKGGIEGGGIHSGRRTFGFSLIAGGSSKANAHHLLGNKSMETTEKQLKGAKVNDEKVISNAY